ncbi:MAG: ABC transporter permease DevC [Acidobacteria bacterium]|nr:ABC transporter permease DevC [Acidobacteriota bacterium]
MPDWGPREDYHRDVAAAVAGIVFAVVLMLIQLGFQDALMTSAGVHMAALDCDLILATPQYQYLLQSGFFPERRLYQAAAHEQVAGVAPLYLTGLPFKNPVTREQRMILVMGVPPRPGIFSVPAVNQQILRLRDPEQVLFDSKGRTEYGPIAEMIGRGQPVETEVANRRTVVAGLFEIGTTFGVDGTIVVGDDAFFRLVPGRERGEITLGLIRLNAGADPEQVRQSLAQRLPNDVRVYTRRGFVEHEQHYWSTNTPVGFIFKLGVSMGLFVGLIIVYQILYNDVMENLQEYATLKAIGFTDRYLAGVVLQQGLILSVLGFLPGAGLTVAIYDVTAKATFLPLGMTLERLAIVYALTAGMCLVAAALAMRPVRKIDPPDIL